jgi:hypothetical protein
MEIKEPEKNVYEELELANAMLIGFMIGTYDVLGKGGTQAVVNMTGKTVAKEFLRFARDKGKPIESLEDFQAFVSEYKLAGEMEFHDAEDIIFVRISNCKTCPKKVGHYQFDGTACPWGGILSGVLNEIHDDSFSSASKLVPGEKCILEVSRTKSKS